MHTDTLVTLIRQLLAPKPTDALKNALEVQATRSRRKLERRMQLSTRICCVRYRFKSVSVHKENHHLVALQRINTMRKSWISKKNKKKKDFVSSKTVLLIFRSHLLERFPSKQFLFTLIRQSLQKAKSKSIVLLTALDDMRYDMSKHFKPGSSQ